MRMRMVKRPFKSWVWAAWAAVAVYLVQLLPLISELFPVRGPVAYLLSWIFLVPALLFMMLGGPLWPGVLLHVTMVLLIIDCRSGKTPKWLLAFPIAFYGIGFAVFVNSWLPILVR